MQIASLGVAGVAVAGLLSGCGGSDSDSAGQVSATPPSPPPAAAPPEQPAPGAGAGNAQVTAPGTSLKIGQRAVVPLKRASTTGTLGITVTAIEPGDQAAFTQQFGSRGQGMTPYYIRYTVTNVGGTDLSRTTAPLLNAVGPNGGSTGATVIFTGALPGCERGRPDASFASAGATYQHCRLQVARQGVPVTGAEYDDREGGYNDGPLVWTR
ncbi:hypothetical protein [Actinomadura rugatobispora]|uniref:DUF4352 domain-containing protein n=1 Tax=Actinomadura rugatobispora TaxID=1994 RepID=A0ABW1AAM8_9ACTN|nr:hypothetical protein GCM10010200_026720 [Actinomadura rugatobispora]